MPETLRDAWLLKAQALQDDIEKWRATGETERRLPDELFEALKAAGLYHLMLPAALGGNQVKLESAVRAIEEVSRHDGSVGWNLMIGTLGGTFADYLPPAGAKEMLGDGAVAVGSFAPTGQAHPVEGGYRVSGSWAFGSGCHNSDWLSGGFLVMEDGRPRLTANGAPDIRIMFFPTADCDILDTWHTVGLRGTGSHDFKIEDAFIPEERGFPFDDLFRGPSPGPERAYAQPLLPHLVAPCMAAISLGIARDAIETFKKLAKAKTPGGSTMPLAAQHTAQMRLGQAEALLRSARAYLYETVREVDAMADDAPEDPVALAASVRLACAHCAESGTQAVDLMFDAAGGTSVYEASRLAKCFRDAHIVTHHILVSPSSFEMVGQYLLGFELQLRR